MKRNLLISMLVGTSFCTAAFANDLVYTPVNPSFGGSSFNSAHLLGIAEIHRPDPPESSRDLFGDDLSESEQFARALESRILSELTFDIVDRIFNGTTQSGQFDVTDRTQLDFVRNLDGSLVLTIRDLVSLAETTITVPAFINDPVN